MVSFSFSQCLAVPSLLSLPLFQVFFLIDILMPLILPQAFTSMPLFRLFPLLGMPFLSSLQLGKLLFLLQDTSGRGWVGVGRDRLPLGAFLSPSAPAPFPTCRVVQNNSSRELASLADAPRSGPREGRQGRFLCLATDGLDSLTLGLCSFCFALLFVRDRMWRGKRCHCTGPPSQGPAHSSLCNSVQFPTSEDWRPGTPCPLHFFLISVVFSYSACIFLLFEINVFFHEKKNIAE